MYTIPDLPCTKCGGNTSIKFIPSLGMDIEKTGLKRTCHRCGYSHFIDALDSKQNADNPL